MRTSRRMFLTGSAAVATAATLGQRVEAQPATTKPAALRMRKNVESLSSTELQAYERAIEIVKKRSAANSADPEGYDYWAGLHNNFDVTHSGCAHFSEKFFPWHRRHLFDFENVLRKADPAVTADVMIPYWDWSKPPKEGVKFPKAFENQASPLFTARRNRTPPPWDAADLKGLVQETDWGVFAGLPDPSDGFGQFPGNVELGPHNTLHGNISRQMADPFSAAMDPIFWSFHAFIDVVWTRWQRLFVTDQKPQPFADGAAVLWYLDRSFPVSSTAKTSDYNYAYEYDYSIDAPAPVVASAGIRAPAKNVAALAAVSDTARSASFKPAAPVAPASNSVLRLSGVRVFRDKTYAVDVYLNPPGIDISSLGPEARRTFLVRKISLWRAHHDQTIEAFLRLDPAQIERLNSGWVVTLKTEANLGDEELSGMLTASPSPTFALPNTSSLVGGVEIQER
jgi:Common central domain of tyrosinase